jgi:hypothetical protein
LVVSGWKGIQNAICLSVGVHNGYGLGFVLLCGVGCGCMCNVGGTGMTPPQPGSIIACMFIVGGVFIIGTELTHRDVVGNIDELVVLFGFLILGIGIAIVIVTAGALAVMNDIIWIVGLVFAFSIGWILGMMYESVKVCP